MRMDKRKFRDIIYQMQLLQEYEMAQRWVGDDEVQPPPPDELEQILRRIEGEE